MTEPFRYRSSRDDSIQRVEDIVAEIIDGIAPHPLAPWNWTMEIRPADWYRAEIERVTAWAREKRGWSASDSALGAVREGGWWEKGARVCLAAGEHRRLLPLLLERMRVAGDDDRGAVARFVYLTGLPETTAVAREWLTHKNSGVRYWAAMILLRQGDRAKGEGIRELEAALRDFDRRGNHHAWAANEEGWLEEKGVWKGEKVTRTLSRSDWMTWLLAKWRRDSFLFEDLAPDDVRATKRAEMREWYARQVALIKAGEKPEMSDKPRALPAIE